MSEADSAGFALREHTQSVCPRCLEPIAARILIGGGRVIMRKRCETHGDFEALISSDAEIVRRLSAV